MKKFVSFEKKSKKEQKAINNAKRGEWGLCKVVTVSIPNKKKYNRKRDNKVVGF